MESISIQPSLKFDPERRSCIRVYPFKAPILKSFVDNESGSEFVLAYAKLIARVGISVSYIRKDLIHASR